MKYIILLLLTFGCATAFAQSIKSKADEFYNNQDWPAAIDSYKTYLSKNGQDSAALYNTAQAYLNIKQYDKALEYFDLAEKNNFSINAITLGRSQAYLDQKQHDKALEIIHAGAKKGASFYMALKNDPKFKPLQENDNFEAVLTLLETNAYPCLASDQRRHFDFWLGEWDVYANGRKVGDNSITRANGGCAIHENYTTGTRNYTGQSINYYDPIDKKWHQHWVGSAGDVYNYIETDQAEGMLQLESKFMNAQGQISLSRLTFTLNDDGTVRQLFESSTDNGATWIPAFDGLYKKKEKKY